MVQTRQPFLPASRVRGQGNLRAATEKLIRDLQTRLTSTITDQGYQHLGDNEVSAASQVDVVFTARNYRAFRIEFVNGTVASSGWLHLRLRSGGSQVTSSSYRHVAHRWSGTATSPSNSTGGTGPEWLIAWGGTSTANFMADVAMGTNGRWMIRTTGFDSSGGAAASNATSHMSGWYFSDPGPIDGFHLNSSAGNISGLFRVWGLL